MFSQRKRFYERKSFYAIIIVLLLAFGFWINQDPAAEQGAGGKEPAVITGEQVPGSGKTESDASQNSGSQQGNQRFPAGYDNSGSNNGNYGSTNGYDGTSGGGYGGADGYDGYDGSSGSGYSGADGYDRTNGYGGGDGYGDPAAESSGQVYGNGEADAAALTGPGYLVKEDGGYIKIYSLDERGDRKLVRTTDISFSLLSESDQKLFKQGIVKKTQDGLSDLLQDFES